jgi:hypothetical protein
MITRFSPGKHQLLHEHTSSLNAINLPLFTSIIFCANRRVSFLIYVALCSYLQSLLYPPNSKILLYQSELRSCRPPKWLVLVFSWKGEGRRRIAVFPPFANHGSHVTLYVLRAMCYELRFACYVVRVTWYVIRVTKF